jgi:hypothetical protein
MAFSSLYVVVPSWRNKKASVYICVICGKLYPSNKNFENEKNKIHFDVIHLPSRVGV